MPDHGPFMAHSSFSPFVTGATCVLCGHVVSVDDLRRSHVCPHHPDYPNEGILDINYNYQNADLLFPGPGTPLYAPPKALLAELTQNTGIASASAFTGLWRYRALLPLSLNASVPPLHVGMTPLYDAPPLAHAYGLTQVLVKDDSRQPTASFKDRASCLAVALAKEQGYPAIATASTGNAAAALAGMAASVQMPCVIFVPESAPAAKVAQLLAFGARIFLVQGSYDQAFDLCMEACRRNGWYNRNTAYNPHMAEGKKSAVFEIVEQMAWDVPDALFVGVGDGCIMAGLHKGFCDLIRLGRIHRMPRLYGIQAEGSDFLWQAQQEGRFSPQDILAKAPIAAHTVADSICAGLPRDRVKAMRAVRESGGSFVRVSDSDILAAIPELAQTCGIFAEPAAAAPLAGLKAAVAAGIVSPADRVCLLVTGSGLKDVNALAEAPQRVPPKTLPPLSATGTFPETLLTTP